VSRHRRVALNNTIPRFQVANSGWKFWQKLATILGLPGGGFQRYTDKRNPKNGETFRVSGDA